MGGQALVPERGSKSNVIAGIQYKALTESCWIWLSDNDRASRKLVLLEMETRLSGIEDWQCAVKMCLAHLLWKIGG